MRNSKVIVLSGFARGGTNILWNIIQSHPQICTPIHETGQIFQQSGLLRLIHLSHTSLQGTKIPFKRSLLDLELYRLKMETLNHPDNRYKAEDVLYSTQDVEKAALCLKSVNDDIYITDLLLDTYPDLYFIALTRNGYALCDGYLRRGLSIDQVANSYNSIAAKMRKLSYQIDAFKLLHFEDVLQSPFQVAEDIFAFLDFPFRLEKIRLKSKRVISSDGEHQVKYGHENKKYWFSRDEISQILNPRIDTEQQQRVSRDQVGKFAALAQPALQFFGY